METKRKRRARVRDWSLRITFCDEPNNMFLILGGATWKTKAERDANLASIPAASGDSPFIVDVLNDYDHVDDRLIEASTAERLAGKPINLLIEDARLAEAALRKAESNG